MILPRLCGQTDSHEYCGAAARFLLRDRDRRYPALVTKGVMTAQASADGLEWMRCIAAQWEWVLDPNCPPAPPWDATVGQFGAPNRILNAEMSTIAANARARADRSPQFEITEMADLCEALAWYQVTEFGEARIVRLETDRRKRLRVMQTHVRAA